jgi:putative tricarboxylic transport membrane protein
MFTPRVPAIVLGLCAALASAPQAAADEPFYKGKRLTLIINFAAGGPTDIEGRLLAKHLPKHIEGHPGIIVQNMDGAGGMIGAGYLGEVAPKDGTALGYFTGSAWRYANNPERFRVDFRSYEFVAYQPGTSIAYMRTDVPPGIKEPSDIVKAKGVVAGGLGAENSKDLLLRLALDMLGVPYKYVTSYRGSQAARLALQQNEINMYAESPPSYRAVVEPTLVKDGSAIGLWYDANPAAEVGHPARQVEGLPLVSFPELYRKIKGDLPSGQLWDGLPHRAHHQRRDAAADRAAAQRSAGGARRPAHGRAQAKRGQGACRGSGAHHRLRAGMDRRPRHQQGGALSDQHLSRHARLHRRLHQAGGEVAQHWAPSATDDTCLTSSARSCRNACSPACAHARRAPRRAGSGGRSAAPACPRSPHPTGRRACAG